MMNRELAFGATLISTPKECKRKYSASHKARLSAREGAAPSARTILHLDIALCTAKDA